MTDRPSPEESARLLRQRIEMGGGRVVLGDMTREEALALLASARGGGSEAASASAAASRAGSTSATSTAGGRSATSRPAGSSSTSESAGSSATSEPEGRSATSAPAGPASTTAPKGRAAPAGGSTPTAPPPPPSTSTSPSFSERLASASAASAPAPSASASSASGAGSKLPVLPDVYGELRDVALACTRCRLSDGRTQVVFSDGPSDARLMVVGEAPGANEDETGRPFVGAAGKYLDLLLSTVGLSREDSVYIANVLKCRPPGNRNPLPDEIETCSPFLLKQIELVQPQALLAVGSFSGKLLTGREKSALGKLRGEVHRYHGVPLIVTYHPAALLRNPNWTRLFWEDLQLLRDVMDSA